MKPERLNGNWYNELGSVMTLQVQGENIVGTYQTAVGDAKGLYKLVGRSDTDNHESETVGWVVNWKNQYGDSDSVTTWSGQIQAVDGEDIIATTWLLTSETAPGDDWHSTLVGKDTFSRDMPSADEITKNASRGVMPAHPNNK